LRLQAPTLIGALALLGYAAFCGYLYFSQERLIFRSDLAPKDVDLDARVVRKIVDGIEVGIIDNGNDVSLFYFGGNANNALEFLRNCHGSYNCIAMNYPGYGNSRGKPSQRSIFEAATKVFERFKTSTNILVGRSLGSGVAAYIASRHKVTGLILITPYHSLTHLAQLRYPLCPVGLLIKHPFPTYAYIEHVDAPVCIITAQNDDTTPPATLQKLFPHIKHLRGLYQIPDSTHADILSHPSTMQTIERCIKSFADSPAPGA